MRGVEKDRRTNSIHRIRQGRTHSFGRRRIRQRVHPRGIFTRFAERERVRQLPLTWQLRTFLSTYVPYTECIARLRGRLLTVTNFSAQLSSYCIACKYFYAYISHETCFPISLLITFYFPWRDYKFYHRNRYQTRQIFKN